MLSLILLLANSDYCDNSSCVSSSQLTSTHSKDYYTTVSSDNSDAFVHHVKVTHTPDEKGERNNEIDCQLDITNVVSDPCKPENCWIRMRFDRDYLKPSGIVGIYSFFNNSLSFTYSGAYDVKPRNETYSSSLELCIINEKNPCLEGKMSKMVLKSDNFIKNI